MKRTERPDPPITIVERGRRLSRSRLWTLQRAVQEARGPESWCGGCDDRVPSHVTSNSFTAGAYARTIVRFVQDCLRCGVGDAARPFYVVELGAGAGRFGFLCLRRLQALAAALLPDGVELRYVLTDISQKLLAFWEGHPSFAPLLERGALDVARFDALADPSFETRRNGWRPGGNPVVFVANYLFDALPHDLFRVSEGGLSESRPVLGLADSGGDLLRDGRVDYEHVPVSLPYADDPTLGEVLRGYTTTLEQAVVPVPVGGVRVLRNVAAVADGRGLLLVGDKGYGRARDLEGLAAPDPARHGGVLSMMVNFHAVAAVARSLGGAALHTVEADPRFQVAAYVLGLDAASFPETRQAFADTFARLGPADFLALTVRDPAAVAATPLDRVLALLRLSEWDPRTFFAYSEPVLAGIADATPRLQRRFVDALRRVGRNVFPVGTERDVPFEIGRVLYRAGAYEEALAHYAQSVRLYGDSDAARCNEALCRRALESEAGA